ncbi:hypothetical protein Taro_001690 [Colocasia esculenta]|uniref:Uncharacterized protein n=1 Tax=Colocasia esculenta TaxID=4460 RepID=A0A843TEB2_COLES|nr:hypothetical protein [Colocasia esculenta]
MRGTMIVITRLARTMNERLDAMAEIKVAISSRDKYCVEVSLRCMAVDGDGHGLHESNDGGILATIMAAGFKGELSRFQTGITLEISRLDAWYSDDDGSLQAPATYIVRGLCRRCCLPELILRCMQVSLSLTESGDPSDHLDDLIELVASSQSGMFNLFSQHQLQSIPCPSFPPLVADDRRWMNRLWQDTRRWIDGDSVRWRMQGGGGQLMRRSQ